MIVLSIDLTVASSGINIGIPVAKLHQHDSQCVGGGTEVTAVEALSLPQVSYAGANFAKTSMLQAVRLIMQRRFMVTILAKGREPFHGIVPGAKRA